ncbi:MAG: hypothetical protein KDJ65_01775 [Anaerolineae bacterium]|nr:hypothetical protein [Anaerolineae bacterium]
MNDGRLLYDLQQRIGRLEAQIETGRWEDWIPTITQSSSVTYTLTSGFARYVLSDRTITARMRVGITGSGVAGNAIIIGGLPYDISDVTGDIGIARIVDTGSASYVGSCNVQNATSFQVVRDGGSSGIGIAPNFALASGDVIALLVAYEVSL